ncbi:hypothetical protein [uncultured Lacticaseibacillus sp.]|jgi:hypothetical protein|uniref:hypothetical protein n=1 Tax=uncultured Lacticaseibacillus sp. TaxID=2775882 RepID=UPI002592ADA6|nr:hypothetical protein [uncultured Lacticaseibacillus sp.]
MDLDEFIKEQQVEMNRIRPYNAEAHIRLTNKINKSRLSTETLARNLQVDEQSVIDAIYGALDVQPEFAKRVESMLDEDLRQAQLKPRAWTSNNVKVSFNLTQKGADFVQSGGSVPISSSVVVSEEFVSLYAMESGTTKEFNTTNTVHYQTSDWVNTGVIKREKKKSRMGLVGSFTGLQVSADNIMGGAL